MVSSTDRPILSAIRVFGYTSVRLIIISHYRKAKRVDEKVDVRKAFRAFGTILAEGQRVGNEYHLNGIVAYSSHDGYTVTIRNDYVKLDIFFHNKFSFYYSSRKEKTLFLEKINALDKPRGS